MFAVELLTPRTVEDPHVRTYSCVLVEDGPLDHGAIANAEVGDGPGTVGEALRFVFEASRAAQDRVADRHLAADSTAQPNHAALQPGLRLHIAAIAEQGLVQGRGVDAPAGRLRMRV